MLDLLGLLLSLRPAPDAVADSDLVLALRNGDGAAFRSLFDRYHLALYRFIVRAGVPAESAEDILQDVFSGAWAQRARLDPTQSVRAYLYRACRNRSANYFRDRAILTDDLQREPAQTGPEPDDEAHFAQLQDHLSDAISSLPDRRRAVFELCFIDGLSYKEAAATLGVSPKTVENQMGHALKAIREKLTPFLGGG